MKRVRTKLNAEQVENQNANVDERSFGGRIGAVSSEVMKQYALDECMSEMAKNNHLNNEIYIHDLDHYAVGDHNCLSIPFDDLLSNGFNTRQTDVRPAQSVSTAFQLVAVIFQLQSLQQFGGVSATHIDWTMVPYVRKSFSKHMKDALHFIEGIEDVEYINSVPNELRFDDEEANTHKNSYEYAMAMTQKEIYQAVEGMYHNLKYIWVA
jgi:ribonucleoside-triphosphate reductase